MLKTIYNLLIYFIANYIGITIPVWLIVGNIYNHVFQDYINASVNNLYQQVIALDPLKSHPHTNYKIASGRALISKKITVSYDIDNTFSTEELEQYLKKQGYMVERKHGKKLKDINEKNIFPFVEENYLLDMKNDDYQISFIIPEYDDKILLVYIEYNDFLNRQNF